MKININIKSWNIEELTGYKPLTTIYEDFSIADNFGEPAIIDTYNRLTTRNGICFHNYKYMTELVMALNHKIWEHYETDKIKAQLYDELWRKAQKIVFEKFDEKQLQYYYTITD